MKKLRSVFVLVLVALFAVSCANNKELCGNKKVKPSDVWYNNKNSNKIYR